MFEISFVKGSYYISGAQSTKLWSGFAACLQMPWFLMPPEHQWTSCCLCMCILQIRSFNWCRFLSYSCTVFMSRNVRKFSLTCVTSVTWTNLSLYLIITWRIKKSSKWRSYCSGEYLEFNLRGCNYQTKFPQKICCAVHALLCFIASLEIPTM